MRTFKKEKPNPEGQLMLLHYGWIWLKDQSASFTVNELLFLHLDVDHYSAFDAVFISSFFS